MFPMKDNKTHQVGPQFKIKAFALQRLFLWVMF